MRRAVGLLTLFCFLCVLAVAAHLFFPSAARARPFASPTVVHVANTPHKRPAPRSKSNICIANDHEARLKAQDEALVAGLQGQLVRVTLPPSPNLRGREIGAWIYLPPGYATSEMRYPVAYVLHGAPGGVRDSFVNGQVHRVAEQLITQKQVQPMILVSWEAQGPKGLDDSADYLDRKDGSWQMESFLLNELVPYIDDHYRTLARPESRALVGFSAGGYGAANLGLKHPDVFRVMCSHAGFFDPNDDPPVMTNILGPKSKLWDANSPLLQTRDMPDGLRLHLYMDCGRNDSLLHEFRKMETQLRTRHVDFEAHVFDGAHDWNFLHAHYFDSLRFCDARWKEMAGGQ